MQSIHMTTWVPRGNGKARQLVQVCRGHVLLCINSNFHRSIMNPFELLTGTEMRQATDVNEWELLRKRWSGLDLESDRIAQTTICCSISLSYLKLSNLIIPMQRRPNLLIFYEHVFPVWTKSINNYISSALNAFKQVHKSLWNCILKAHIIVLY